MTIEIWFAPAMLALVIWGVTAFLPKIVLRMLSPLHMLVIHSMFFLSGALIAQLFFGWPECVFPAVYFAVFTGACGTFGQLLYLVALRRGPVTQVSMISSLYPLVATMLALTLLHDHISLRQGLGVALGITAIVLLVKADDRHEGAS
jgi:transporter family protein